METIIFTKELQDIKVTEVGIQVTLECELSKPGLKVDWFKGDKQVRRDTRYDFVSKGTEHRLVIEKVESEDVGEYRVEYQKLSSSAKLSVEGECGNLSWTLVETWV